MNVIDILKERGFIEKTTHEKQLIELFEKHRVTCYIGFDPTASSLHVGSLIPIMALVHMQRQGHRPIALVGGGTGLVGDPSGKTEMRKMLTIEEIEENTEALRKQLSRFLDFNSGKGLIVNNADWLTELKYIPFLRDIGRHFMVNRMIKAESYRMRLESEEGLNFIEFNYMLLQAYDFLMLFDTKGCRLQMGGSDQWGNIIAGIELVRRTRRETVFGITFPLITTSTGEKMGKTAKGAIWLDAARTTPYDYYQYWVNTDDRDVARFLALFTFLPMDEIRATETITGAELNSAKAILAYEATLLAHGEQEALKAHRAAESMFGHRAIPLQLLPSSTVPRDEEIQDDRSVPHSVICIERLKEGVPAFKMFHNVGLTRSSSEARRLIEQGGAYINGRRIRTVDTMITDKDVINMQIILRAGKKHFHRIEVK
ncbi:MAG: tyrosine--tRNA ligase [Deltaproteobacteria bacterium]|nr:tyrosine--tRNA ligase [Deltaproteobacteria bacterium]MBW1995533.1 tyrosine--tRNA ligase [Deltaproteobacteria bacterium]MBW2153099.1 tyrosine--tRNA ligase [Deltaproteobacteria bacterium]